MAFSPAAMLFDLDGTVLDTAPDLGAALNEVLRAHNRSPMPADKVRPMASHGSTGLLKLGFGDDFNEQTKAELRAQFLAAYEPRVCHETRLFPGIAELFDWFQTNDLPYAIVTNKPTRYTDLALQGFPELKGAGSVVCGDTLDVAKPHPAPLLHAAQQLNVSPEACWYIGDAERDIVAGRNASMYTVLAAYGYVGDEDDLASWHADCQVETVQELQQLCERLLSDNRELL